MSSPQSSQFSRQDSTRQRKNFATKLFTHTGRELGRGAYGRIFEVEYQGTLCAAKEVHQTLLEHANKDELLYGTRMRTKITIIDSAIEIEIATE